MKSFKSVYQYSPLSLATPPLLVIDDTNVQASLPVVKNKKINLLNAVPALFFYQNTIIKGIRPKKMI